MYEYDLMMEGNLVLTSCGFTLDIYYRKHLNSYKKLFKSDGCQFQSEADSLSFVIAKSYSVSV